MENIKRINEIVEKSKEYKWWYSNKNQVKQMLNKEPELIKTLKSQINSNKNLSILRFCEKIEIHLEEEVIMNVLSSKSNINQHVYAVLYSLYKRKNIESNCFKKVQKEFQIMKNVEQLFEDTENKYIVNRMEMDRYNYKKEKEEILKIKDRKKEMYEIFKDIKPIKFNELVMFKSIKPYVNYGIMFCFDNIFRILSHSKQHNEAAHKMYSRISNLNNWLFDCERRTYKNQDSLKSEFKLLKEKNKSHHSLLNEMDRLSNRNISRVKRIISNLDSKNIKYKVVTSTSMSRILAELIVFDFSSVEFENICSLQQDSISFFISKFLNTENLDRIILAGEFRNLEEKNNVKKYDFLSLEDAIKSVNDS